MDTSLRDVLRVLDEVLSLGGRAAAFNLDTRLLGALPEFDSMAVVALLTALEDQLGVAFADDDIDGDQFATVGTLVALVDSKRAG